MLRKTKNSGADKHVYLLLWIKLQICSMLAMYMQHATKCSAFMRDFTGQSRFRAVPAEMLKQELLDMTAANPGHLPFLLHYGTGAKLGRVAITILVSSTHKKTHTEYMAVEPEGFRWAGAVSTSVAALLCRTSSSACYRCCGSAQRQPRRAAAAAAARRPPGAQGGAASDPRECTGARPPRLWPHTTQTWPQCSRGRRAQGVNLAPYSRGVCVALAVCAAIESVPTATLACGSHSLGGAMRRNTALR